MAVDLLSLQEETQMPAGMTVEGVDDKAALKQWCIIFSDGLRCVFLADTFWGVAAGLWIITGLIRAFTGLEKGAAYYLDNSLFLVKMGLLGLILILEVWPMTTLIRWRKKLRQGQRPDLTAASAIARISQIQVILVVLMVFAATAMARGIGTDLW